MTSVDLSLYKKLYLQTAKENSDVLSNNYNKTLRNSLDKDAWKDMYINAHSLKSKSQAMGYIKIGAISGMIEKTIKNILANDAQVPNGLMVVIKDAIDNIQASLLNIERDDNKNSNYESIVD